MVKIETFKCNKIYHAKIQNADKTKYWTETTILLYSELKPDKESLLKQVTLCARKQISVKFGFLSQVWFFLGFLWFLFVFCIFNMILHLEITNLHESFGYWYSFKNSLTTFKKKLDINHLHIFLKCKSICHTDLYIY